MRIEASFIAGFFIGIHSSTRFRGRLDGNYPQEFVLPFFMLYAFFRFADNRAANMLATGAGIVAGIFFTEHVGVPFLNAINSPLPEKRH